MNVGSIEHSEFNNPFNGKPQASVTILQPPQAVIHQKEILASVSHQV